MKREEKIHSNLAVGLSSFSDLVCGIVGDKKLNGYTVRDILAATGVPSHSIKAVDLNQAIDPGNLNVLIIARDAEIE